MKEARYFYVPDAPEATELPAEEAVHAVRVLRLKGGDEFFVMNGKGAFYRAEVTMASAKHCYFSIKEALPQERKWRGRIHLAIAPTKDIGRMEWLAEKATEVGFDEITFLSCHFSERKTVRQDRIEKIVVSAMKQSRKAWMPVVNAMTPFHECIDAHLSGAKYICHCYEEFPKHDFMTSLARLNPDDDVTILVGPECDFSVDEVRYALAKGYVGTSLGSSRLRTETAGLVAVVTAALLKRAEGNKMDIQETE